MWLSASVFRLLGPIYHTKVTACGIYWFRYSQGICCQYENTEYYQAYLNWHGHQFLIRESTFYVFRDNICKILEISEKYCVMNLKDAKESLTKRYRSVQLKFDPIYQHIMGICLLLLLRFWTLLKKKTSCESTSVMKVKYYTTGVAFSSVNFSSL